MDFDEIDLLPDEYSYQRLSDDIHKKLILKWNKFKTTIDESMLSKEAEKAYKDFDNCITYFFE